MSSMLYLSLASLVLLIGFSLMFDSSELIAGQKVRKRNMEDYLRLAKNRLFLDSEEAAELFSMAQLPISLRQYHMIRLAAVIVLVLWGMIQYFRQGNVTPLVLYYGAALLLAVLTIPQRKILGMTSPFLHLVSKMREKRQQEYDKELYQAIGQLKNICITNQDHPKNGDAILEELIRYTNLTRPFFAQTLSLFRLQQYDAARSYFTQNIGTKLSRDFIHILLELDVVSPKEFILQLKTFQDSEREKRLTQRLNERENRSVLLYIPAMVTCVVILLNFIMVTLWVSARASLFQ